MKHIIDSLLERIEINKLTSLQHRALISGYGTEIFAEELARRTAGHAPKIFLNLPYKPQQTTDNVILEGDFREKLSVFPDNTFDLIVLLWTLSITNPQGTIESIWKKLKKGGQSGLVISLDSSPKIPLKTINQILKEKSSIKLKLYRTELPADLSSLRKLMEKSGFVHSRVWGEAITHNYPDTNAVFDALINQSSQSLFDKKVSSSDQTYIRERFCELLPMTNNNVEVKFDLGLATGTK
jgi:predicted RNA binding protein YcfA (HicA-like mRNA interferase family)